MTRFRYRGFIEANELRARFFFLLVFRFVRLSYVHVLSSCQGRFVRDHRHIPYTRVSNIFYVVVRVFVFRRAAFVACRAVHLCLYQVGFGLWLGVFHRHVGHDTGLASRRAINFLRVVCVDVIAVSLFNGCLGLFVFMIARSVPRCDRRRSAFPFSLS